MAVYRNSIRPETGGRTGRGEMVALCAGLDVQHTLDHGDQLIGVQGAFRRRKSHAIGNFRIAAGLKTGELYGMVFQDSDVAKWLAGAASSLAVRPDAAIEKTEQLAADVCGVLVTSNF